MRALLTCALLLLFGAGCATNQGAWGVSRPQAVDYESVARGAKVVIAPARSSQAFEWEGIELNPCTPDRCAVPVLAWLGPPWHFGVTIVLYDRPPKFVTQPNGAAKTIFRGCAIAWINRPHFDASSHPAALEFHDYHLQSCDAPQGGP